MATYSYSECIVHIAFPLQQWLRERTSVYMYIACLVTASCRRLVLSRGERFASTLNADSWLGRRVSILTSVAE